MLAKQLATALEKRDLTTASELLAQMQREQPNDPNTQLMAGILARLSGRLEVAHSILGELHGQYPGLPPIAFHFANCEKDLGRSAHAAELYEAVLRLRPEHADAAFNLGECRRFLGDDAACAQAFARSGQLRRDDAESVQQVVDAAARLARQARSPPTKAGLEPGHPSEPVSVVCCSIDTRKQAALRRNLEGVLHGLEWELVFINDARSLCEGYRRGAEQARFDRLVFCHDDIEFLDADAGQRLSRGFALADAFGVHGSTRASGPSVAWSGMPFLHGRVSHPSPGDGIRAGIASLAPARVTDAETLDGVLLAAHRRVVDTVGFDDQTFDGFHFYDLDFSYRAACAGFRVEIHSDLHLLHASEGDFTASYNHYAKRFLEKFPQFAGQPPGNGYLFVSELEDREQLRRFHEWISYLLDVGQSAE